LSAASGIHSLLLLPPAPASIPDAPPCAPDSATDEASVVCLVACGSAAADSDTIAHLVATLQQDGWRAKQTYALAFEAAE
jgi:hypothetical protein